MTKSETKSLTIPLANFKIKTKLSKSLNKKIKKSQFMCRPWRPAGTPNPEAPDVNKIESVKRSKEHLKTKVQSPTASSSSSNKIRLNVG